MRGLGVGNIIIEPSPLARRRRQGRRLCMPIVRVVDAVVGCCRSYHRRRRRRLQQPSCRLHFRRHGADGRTQQRANETTMLEPQMAAGDLTIWDLGSINALTCLKPI